MTSKLIRTTTRFFVLTATLLLAGCLDYGRYDRYGFYCCANAARSVSVVVEVFDPNTNQVWQDVDVRIVEAFLEWSGVTRVNPDPADTVATDLDGIAAFDSRRVGAADVGFVLSSSGRALLESATDRDEAIVTLEVSAPGFASVLRDVRVTWSRPNVFVSIPFE